MSETDPVLAVIAKLKADVGIAALVGARVFGDEIPEGETASMPRKCIVVEPAGGTQSFGGGYQNFGDERLDIRCYAETPYQAGVLQRLVHTAMKHMTREVHEGTLLHWATRSAGPLSLRDPDANWPFRFESYQVLYGETEVPA